VLVEALEDVIAYPNGVDKLEISKGSSIELESAEVEFLLKRNLVKEVKPPKPKKEVKPSSVKKETKPAKKAKKETK